MFVFDAFTYRPQTSELSRAGKPVPLQRQPSWVLQCLLEHRGQIVTRDQLKRALWNDTTFVDFDGSLNYCVREVRRALGDTARNPRFIETLPRRGYRFIAPVQIEPPIQTRSQRAVERRRGSLAAAALFLFATGVGIGHETYPTDLHARVVSWLHGGPSAFAR